MYGCKSWTLKKAEGRRIHAFVVLEKTLESPLDCKEIQPVHSEGDQPWDFFRGNDAQAEIKSQKMFIAEKSTIATTRNDLTKKLTCDI